MAQTRPIGTRFELNGETYEVRQSKNPASCSNCGFCKNMVPVCDENIGDVAGECSGMARTDGNYVIFKKC